VIPSTLINKVYRHIIDNDFIQYLEQIIHFVTYTKLKYSYKNITFDKTFNDFMTKKLEMIRRDHKLLLSTYVLCSVTKGLFSDEFVKSIEQYVSDEIKSYRDEKHYLEELKKYMEILENQFNLDILKPHIAEINKLLL
jgi:hypothetical protein